jgi:hypothetical protein
MKISIEVEQSYFDFEIFTGFLSVTALNSESRFYSAVTTKFKLIIAKALLFLAELRRENLV